MRLAGSFFVTLPEIRPPFQWKVLVFIGDNLEGGTVGPGPYTSDGDSVSHGFDYPVQEAVCQNSYQSQTSPVCQRSSVCQGSYPSLFGREVLGHDFGCD